MLKDSVIWIGCILLFLSGVLFALLISISGAGAWLYSWAVSGDFTASGVLQGLSAIATLLMAFAALATVTAWRKQVAYAKRHDAFVKLNVALQDLDVFRIWASAFSDSFIRRYTKDSDEQFDIDTASYVYEQEVLIPSIWRAYRLAVYEAALHMDPHDIEPCLDVSHVKGKLLAQVQSLQNKLDEYRGRQLSQEDWQEMNGLIQVTCSFIRSDCQRIIATGEEYIFRQLREKAF